MTTDTSLQLSIQQRVKKLLHVEGDHTASELYFRLRDYRSQIHPDRYTDREAKEVAEERFKEAQNLLEELFAQIQQEKSRSTPSELQLLTPVYEHVFIQASLDSALAEISNLKQQLEWREAEIKNLREELDDRARQEHEAEKKRLESLYKPGPRSWASLGITLLLSGSLGVMTKLEQVSTMVRKYSPVSEEYLNVTLFTVFALILALVCKQILEGAMMKRRVREVSAPITVVQFLNYLRENIGRPSEFTESNVFFFFHGRKKWWKDLLSALGFVYFRTETSDQLKDFFISALLNKELIFISHAHRLDRGFKIREKPKANDWDL